LIFVFARDATTYVFFRLEDNMFEELRKTLPGFQQFMGEIDATPDPQDPVGDFLEKARVGSPADARTADISAIVRKAFGENNALLDGLEKLRGFRGGMGPYERKRDKEQERPPEPIRGSAPGNRREHDVTPVGPDPARRARRLAELRSALLAQGLDETAVDEILASVVAALEGVLAEAEAAA
jgi:hypothetical protein